MGELAGALVVIEGEYVMQVFCRLLDFYEKMVSYGWECHFATTISIARTIYHAHIWFTVRVASISSHIITVTGC
ncbi:hypothetical protein AAC387_Pa03g0442 [Persea americana]